MLGKSKITPGEAFGAVLRRQQKALGQSQESLALEAGVQRNYVSLMELGRNQPTVTTIFKLAAPLRMKAANLISERMLRPSKYTCHGSFHLVHTHLRRSCTHVTHFNRVGAKPDHQILGQHCA